VATAAARPRAVIPHESLPLGTDGTLRLVAVADTHSQPHARAAERVASFEPAFILHGGDIGDLRVLDGLREIAPTIAVRGNIDTRADAPPETIVLDVVDDRGRVALGILLTHIAVFGPKIRAEVARKARAESATLIVCGHSHVPFIGRDQGLGVFNPGSIGPRRFQLPIVFGVIDIAPTGVRLRHIDCETGERWEPPAARR
jgi:uncharacterized protein